MCPALCLAAGVPERTSLAGCRFRQAHRRNPSHTRSTTSSTLSPTSTTDVHCTHCKPTRGGAGERRLFARWRAGPAAPARSQARRQPLRLRGSAQSCTKSGELPRPDIRSAKSARWSPRSPSLGRAPRRRGSLGAGRPRAGCAGVSVPCAAAHSLPASRCTTRRPMPSLLRLARR